MGSDSRQKLAREAVFLGQDAGADIRVRGPGPPRLDSRLLPTSRRPVLLACGGRLPGLAVWPVSWLVRMRPLCSLLRFALPSLPRYFLCL